MDEVSVEYVKDLLVTQQKTHSEVTLGPWVIRPFNFLFKLKIENGCQFLIFMMFYHKKLESA